MPRALAIAIVLLLWTPTANAAQKCPPGKSWSRAVVACIQTKCPAGAKRTYTQTCNCGEAWNKPFRTCWKNGLATHCVKKGQRCPGERSTTRLPSKPKPKPRVIVKPQHRPLPSSRRAPACNYERRIHTLSQAIKKKGMSSKRIRASAKYVDYIREMENLDRYSRYTFCSDEEGNATLKFNTPEERLYQSITRLNGLISSFAAAFGGLAGAAASAQKDLERLQTAHGQVMKQRGKGLTKKGPMGPMFNRYQKMVRSRKTTMANLDRLADKTICRQFLSEELQLAKLLHRTIPRDRSCNKLLQKALSDRIRRTKTLGFGRLFDPKGYRTLKRRCGWR